MEHPESSPRAPSPNSDVEKAIEPHKEDDVTPKDEAGQSGENTLTKALRSRHMQMIAIGSSFCSSLWSFMLTVQVVPSAPVSLSALALLSIMEVRLVSFYVS